MQQPPRPPFTSAGQAGLAPPGMVALNSVQLIRPGAPGPQRSVATVSPRILVGNPVQRPLIPQQILNTVQGSSQGQFLLKTDGGQYQLLRVGQGPVAALNAQAGRPTITAGLAGQSAVTLVPMPMIEAHMANQTQQQMMAHPLQLSTAQQLPAQESISVPVASISTMPTPQLGNSQAGQQIIRPPDNSNQKCRNFLANLLDLSTKEPPSVEASVKSLIQELIDGAVESNTFCDRLERLLNASPQPCLIGFLKKSLPLLRQSLVLGELVIQGIAAPPYRVAFPPSGIVQAGPLSVPNLPFNVRMPHANIQGAGTSGIGMVHTRVQNKHHGGGSGSKSWTVNKQASVLRPQPAPTAGGTPGKSLLKEREKTSAFQSAFSEDKMAGDDDINDVAAMGGVNLQEETQRILGNTDMIGSQIRSCKDECLVPSAGLQARIRAHCEARGLAEPPPEVAQLMSHALQERMKSILERLTTNMLHRLDTECKTDEGRYEVSHDVKAKLKFLEDLDRVEKKRREDSERELLLRAAKSRSKNEDPEQAKLKAKAKEMQRAELEEMRQREANLTALQAIGPRKRPRLDSPQDSAPAAQPQPPMGPGGASRLRTRMRRITLRDMLHLLENDRIYARSSILYKAYLKA